MSDFSLLDLFRIEVENQLGAFVENLLQLESRPQAPELLEGLMRAAHSVKGAARLVGVKPAERVAHVLEDCFTAAQAGKLIVQPGMIDLFLSASDSIRQIADQPEGQFEAWVQARQAEYDDLLARLRALAQGEAVALPAAAPRPSVSVETPPPPIPVAAETRERSLRLSAERLDALVGLAGEVQVATGRLSELAGSLLQLKRQIFDMLDHLGRARESLPESVSENALNHLRQAEDVAGRSSEFVTARLEEMEAYDRRMYALSSRLQQAVVSSRMCPFQEAVGGFPRMVRDIARELGKEVELVVEGRQTTVDRDVLERIEGPLNHLLRNAIDHGIEPPAERTAAGKPPQARVLVRASHRSGMLAIEVHDDGRGIHLEQLRQTLVEKGLVSADMASRLRADEVMEFLYLPKFTTKTEVSEISGRGVGLDAVRSTIVDLGGRISLDTVPGQGCQFLLMLPLTLSVSRNLLTEIGGEVYAFPLNRIRGVAGVTPSDITEMQGKSLFRHRGRQVPLVPSAQVLELQLPPQEARSELPVVLVGKGDEVYGLVVEQFLGEQDLVVQSLDGRFGKLRNIAAGSILEDGSAVLILDVEDLTVSIERICASGRLENMRPGGGQAGSRAQRAKRILVVDDSITVREVERKILEVHGYAVDVAVDGMDGWHAVRSSHYDLVVSDVDMPRMDGIKLVSMIKQDAKLRQLPVVIVSYKDRNEDRLRGLDAGADYYLTKASFDDDSFIRAVRDLIGEPL